MSLPGSSDQHPVPQHSPLARAAEHTAPVPVHRPVVLMPPPRIEHPEALSGKPSALALLAALKRRWLMALSLGIVVSASVGAALWFLLPQAKIPVAAMLHVDSKPQSIVAEPSGPRGDFLTYQKTQVAMLRSRLVLNAALRNSKVANLSILAEQDDVLAWLEKNLTVSFADSPEIMRIAMEGHNPEELRLLIDAITEAYLEEVVNRERNQVQKLVDQLKEFSKRYEDRVKSHRRTMRSLQEQMGAGDNLALALKQQTAQLELNMTSQDLSKVRSELRTARTRLSQLERADGTAVEVPEAELQAVLEKDELLRKYTDRQGQLEAAIEEWRKVAIQGESDPGLQRVLAERSKLNAAIARRRNQIVPLLQEQQRVNARSQLVHLRQRVTLLQDLEKQLAGEVASLSKDSKGMVKGHLDLEEIRQDISHLEEMAKAMKTRAERLTIELEAPPRVYRSQEAVIYPVDQTLRRVGIAGGSAGAAFLAVLLIIAYLDFRVLRIASANQLVQALGVNVVGTLPMYSSRSGAQGAVWQRQLLESVDAARTLLLRMASVENLQAVMICSAVSGEGKTSLACHLAASLARAGRKTLLVDGDLRKPAVHRIFQISEGPGLCEMLRGELALEEAVQQSNVPGLSVLAAGTCDELALQALAHKGIASFMQALRGAYDFILVDSSPVLPVADSLILAQHTDGVLFSAMQYVSRLPKIYAACHRLSAVGARLLGAVVTGGQEDVYGSLVSYGPARQLQS